MSQDVVYQAATCLSSSFFRFFVIFLQFEIKRIHMRVRANNFCKRTCIFFGCVVYYKKMQATKGSTRAAALQRVTVGGMSQVRLGEVVCRHCRRSLRVCKRRRTRAFRRAKRSGICRLKSGGTAQTAPCAYRAFLFLRFCKERMRTYEKRTCKDI